MGSDISEHRRVPRQKRGERRVAELLEAAASEFAEVGYDAATVKAMAKRADASIGAVYQYFPNKASIVSALRSQYADEMQDRWSHFEETTTALSLEERTHGFVDLMIRFIEQRPAYVMILDAPADSRRQKKTRDWLRERLAMVLRMRRPALSQEQAYRVANVTLQMIKSMNALYLDAKPQERPGIVKEYKFALNVYLQGRLTPSKQRGDGVETSLESHGS